MIHPILTPAPEVPSLPLHIAERILVLVPEVASGTTPVATLISVLPPKLVPALVACIMAGVFASDSPFADQCHVEPRRLFSDTAANAFSKQLIAHLRPVLEHGQYAEDCRLLLMESIAGAGNLKLLAYLSGIRISGVKLANRPDVLNTAVAEGHMHIVEWWINQGHSMEVLNANAIVSAARQGHLSVLEWWATLETHTAFTLSLSDLVSSVIRGCQVAVLHWWKARFGLSHLVFHPHHWELASELGQCDMLEFALVNRFRLPSSIIKCVDNAAAEGHVQVLEWWARLAISYPHQCRFAFSVQALDKASANGHVAVLKFFANSGHPLRFTPAALQLARENGHKLVVDWWNSCSMYADLIGGRAHKYPDLDLVMCCAFGLADRLTKGFLCRQDEESLRDGLYTACQFGHLQVIKKVLPHVPIDLVVPCNCLFRAVEYGQVVVAQWCIASFPQRSYYGDPWMLFYGPMSAALEKGHVQVLDVLRASDLLPEPVANMVTDESLDPACTITAGARSLEFFNSIMPVCTWTEYQRGWAWQFASAHGNIPALDWLAAHGVCCQPADPLWIDEASANGHYLVLEWWSSSSLTFTFTEAALWGAVRNKHKRVLAWWVKSGRVRGQYMLDTLQAALRELD